MSDPGLAILKDASAEGVIKDNDQPGVSIDDVTVTEGDPAQFRVSLDRKSIQDVSVTWSTADGTATAGADYTAVSNGQVTIPAGSLSQTVTVVTLDDADDEADTETFTVTLSDPGLAILKDASAEGVITDNDEPLPRELVEALNVITGTGTGETLDGTDGADELHGQGGDDILRGGAGDDTLRGGSGTDNLFGEDDDDVLYGDEGGDRLRGGRGKDVLYGEDGADDLRGQGGEDNLHGGKGDDTLTGGSGVDTFHVNGSEGDDVITDFGIHTDYLRFSGVAFADVEEMFADYAVQQGDDMLIYTDEARANSVTLENFSFDQEIDLQVYEEHILIA